MSADLTQAATSAALAYIDQVVEDLANTTRGTPELDEAVARALGWQIKDFANLKFTRRDIDGNGWKLLPALTATFEEAAFYVPPDRGFMLVKRRLFGAALVKPGLQQAALSTDFHTPALALWAAILRDHAARLKPPSSYAALAEEEDAP